MPRSLLLVLAALIGLAVSAQPRAYSSANAHSHNDYENAVPFHWAYDAGFGSIEADIFLRNDSLIVAHDEREVLMRRCLEEYYLDPLLAEVRKNGGRVYADTTKRLQMLIDIKTESVKTLKRLISVLQKYPMLINSSSIQWVITGNRPDPRDFPAYPDFIFFDGELNKTYPPEALPKICMLSEDFRHYAAWQGNSVISDDDVDKLRSAVIRAHAWKKPVRFWDAPDNPQAWDLLMRLGVDYINTDHIADLAAYLRHKGSAVPSAADAPGGHLSATEKYPNT